MPSWELFPDDRVPQQEGDIFHASERMREIVFPDDRVPQQEGDVYRCACFDIFAKAFPDDRVPQQEGDKTARSDSNFNKNRFQTIESPNKKETAIDQGGMGERSTVSRRSSPPTRRRHAVTSGDCGAILFPDDRVPQQEGDPAIVTLNLAP